MILESIVYQNTKNLYLVGSLPAISILFRSTFLLPDLSTLSKSPLTFRHLLNGYYTKTQKSLTQMKTAINFVHSNKLNLSLLGITYILDTL